MAGKNALIIAQGDETFVSLTTQGYHIIEAKNSVEALRSILRIKPDLVVAPVDAPLLNGLALAGLLKLLHVFLPIIFIGDQPESGDIDYLEDAVIFVKETEIETKLEEQ